MSDIDELIPPLKRSIAVPGGFDALFPGASSGDLEGIVYDALAHAQLDGFLREAEVDDDQGTVTPDLTRPGGSLTMDGALVMLYASYQMLLNEVRNRKTHVRYEAGPTVFEEDQTASMLNELLRQAKARLDDIKAARDRGELARETFVVDQHFIRATSDYAGFGLQPLTWGW